MLQAIYSTKFPEPVHGFVSVSKDDKILATTGRGIVTNAAPHVGKDFVLNLDLKDFFSSISATTVRKIFTGFPFYFDWELATCIALVCTYEKKLPTGSPTSPVLSNFACREMDKLLLQLSTENKIIFTRYADDITFSSNVAFNDELIKNILIQIKKSGFTVNEKKFRIQNKFNKQVVTGIKVNSKINVERSFVRNLRAVFHDIDVNGLALASKKYFKSVSGKSEADLISSLNGKIQYLGQVRGKDDPIYLRYLAKINVLEILSK